MALEGALYPLKNKKTIHDSACCFPTSGRKRHPRTVPLRFAFTLTELLVVIAVIAVLMGIMIPVLGRARQSARDAINAVNQRDIVSVAALYTADSDDRYPPSVATIGFGNYWRWQEPRILIGFEHRAPQLHRAMSEYVDEYLERPATVQCPNNPKPFSYLDEAWQAGDNWHHPMSADPPDPLIGSYNIFWNYIGYLKESDQAFHGPTRVSDGASRLLTSDYAGNGHWLSPESATSCEKLPGGREIEETVFSTSFWSGATSTTKEVVDPRSKVNIQLQAGYNDGHVEKYPVANSMILQVAITPDGTIPYPEKFGTGDIYIPRNSNK